MQGVFDFSRDVPLRPERPERLFFGLFPDAATALRVERYAKGFLHEHHLAGTQLRRERLHVSQHHVGDFRRLAGKYIYAAQQAGNAVSMRPFEISLGFIQGFDGAPSTDGKLHSRPLVLFCEGDGLWQLYEMLGAAMEKIGLRAAKRFTPHMTVAYVSEPVARQAIEPIRFLVNEFILIQSELWLTQYNMIDRWSLKG